MIVFDLRCEADHVFEAWFADSAAFARLKAKKQVVCPVCGATGVKKAPMAPRIATGKSRGPGKAAERAGGGNETLALAASPEAKAVLAKLRELKEHVTKNCDYVGGKFAEEARKIHYGEVKKRNIYGEASEDDARSLADEGVEVQRIPWVHQDS